MDVSSLDILPLTPDSTATVDYHLLFLFTQGALWLKYAVLLPKIIFFQSGFPSSLKQFSGPDLCKYSGSRPVWRLRPWHRAGSPEGGQEALQGVKFYLSF